MQPGHGIPAWHHIPLHYRSCIGKHHPPVLIKQRLPGECLADKVEEKGLCLIAGNIE